MSVDTIPLPLIPLTLYNEYHGEGLLPSDLFQAGFLLGWISTPKEKAIRSPETSVYVPNTWCYVPEDGNINIYRCENFYSYMYVYSSLVATVFTDYATNC
jgi:hypothetical protein